MDRLAHRVPEKPGTTIVIGCYCDKRRDILNGAIEPAASQIPAAHEVVVDHTVTGASMCIGRFVFAHAGGLDCASGRTAKALPPGCEATELHLRATRALPHGRFVFEPSSGSDHAIPACRAMWRYFLLRCWAEGLSKSSLSWMAGAREALASEQSDMTKTLSRGVMRGFADMLVGRPSGFLRAVALAAGLAVTAAGFAVGRTRAALARPSAFAHTPAFEPVE